MSDPSRRDLLKTAIVGTNAAALVPNISLANETPVLLSALTVKQRPRLSSMDTQHCIVWVDFFKKQLAEENDWLGVFRKSAVVQAISLFKPVPRYEPLLLDTLLQEASAALDRCLAFRREAYELEIAAVKAAADYALFKELSTIDEKSEILALAIPRLESETTGYRQASAAYADKGFSKHDETLSNSAGAGLKLAARREELIRGRWEVRRRYEANYNSRHTAPGNAHNFAERWIRTVNLLAEDLQEAYEKLMAVRFVLKAIYREDRGLPVLRGEESLDELVMWTREVIRYLDVEAQQEVRYQVVIPLAQQWRPSGRPFIEPHAIRAIIAESSPVKVISFNLSDVFFNQERVRLRGVGLATGPRPGRRRG